MKKVSIIIVTTIVVGTLIFLGMRTFFNKKTEILVINYKQYQELKSDKNNTFIVIFSMTKNKTTHTLETEISKTLKNKKTKVYEIDIDKVDESYYSIILDDINDAKEKESETINIPAVAFFKEGRIVYVNEGYIDNNDFEKVIDEYNIK